MNPGTSRDPSADSGVARALSDDARTPTQDSVASGDSKPQASDPDSEELEWAAAAIDNALSPDSPPLPSNLRDKLMACADLWLAGKDPLPRSGSQPPAKSEP